MMAVRTCRRAAMLCLVAWTGLLAAQDVHAQDPTPQPAVTLAVQVVNLTTAHVTWSPAGRATRFDLNANACSAGSNASDWGTAQTVYDDTGSLTFGNLAFDTTYHIAAAPVGESATSTVNVNGACGGGQDLVATSFTTRIQYPATPLPLLELSNATFVAAVLAVVFTDGSMLVLAQYDVPATPELLARSVALADVLTWQVTYGDTDTFLSRYQKGAPFWSTASPVSPPGNTQRGFGKGLVAFYKREALPALPYDTVAIDIAQATTSLPALIEGDGRWQLRITGNQTVLTGNWPAPVTFRPIVNVRDKGALPEFVIEALREIGVSHNQIYVRGRQLTRMGQQYLLNVMPNIGSLMPTLFTSATRLPAPADDQSPIDIAPVTGTGDPDVGQPIELALDGVEDLTGLGAGFILTMFSLGLAGGGAILAAKSTGHTLAAVPVVVLVLIGATTLGWLSPVWLFMTALIAVLSVTWLLFGRRGA